MSARRPSAAVVAVGSELTTGLRVDTNSTEVAASLTAAGFTVVEAVRVADDQALLSGVFERLCRTCAVVVATGGLGPTHDDVTREAAADALGRPLIRDDAIAERLQRVVWRHADPEAAARIVRQADVIQGATVLPAVTGTAPGQLVDTPGGVLVLLPGPPKEMRPLLESVIDRLPGASPRAATRVLACTGAPESDIQVAVDRVLADVRGVGFTVLARPAVVHVVLTDEGAGSATLATTADAVADALGDRCFSRTGESPAEALGRRLEAAGATIATAESCTGGLVVGALTDVAGSSAWVLGGVTAYANEAKIALLDVEPGMLAQFGAVSEPVARAMAEGVRARLGADIAVATTGIAGPGGGSADKPVGLVWFGLADAAGTIAVRADLMGDRAGVRERAVVFALDLVRRRLDGLL